MSAALRLLIDGAALVANWRWLAAQQPDAACGAAIKADGYGLGAREVVSRLAAVGCRDFFAATWDEAEALGPLPAGALSVLHGAREADMAVALGAAARPVLNTPEQAARWRTAGGGACDVMIDTGMNRLGLTPEDACSGLLDGLAIETLMSHLACAEDRDHPLNARQRTTFAELGGRISARRTSLANSAGVLLGEGYGCDLTRPGLALYGGHPVEGVPIRPVVRLSAEVLQVRDVGPGASVGYGATWQAARASRIAILNLGYADGLFRTLAPQLATVEGWPVVGRISMDLIAVDIGNGDCREGDWIDLPLDLPRLSQASGLSQYELLTSLGRRFERRWG